MKVLFLCGNHPRHLFIAKKLYENGFLCGLVIEKRAEFIVKPPKNIDDELKEIFITHFNDRAECEYKYFGNISESDFSVEKKFITKETLNTAETAEFISSINADAVISYGIHIANENLLNAMPKIKWNIHGGLSPWFKGNITMYWPFYMLMPNYTGATIHELSNKIDGGNIIHQSVPELNYGDKVHDVACKAILKTADDLIKIIKMIDSGEKITPVKQKKNGKLWVSTDWTPEHLRLVYKLYENKIVDMYLDGKIKSKPPELIKAF